MKVMMKTYFLVLLSLTPALTGLCQDQQGMDTSDANKELVISAQLAGTKMDHSLTNASFRTVSIDPDENASLLTLHPRAIPFVKDYLEDNQERLIKMKATALPYFTMIDNILGKYNMPTELKYLAVIESDLKSSAVSWAGAVGPWQFMPETGRLYGLKVSKSRDDRRDLYRSTHAAAKYLKDLYAELNDWLLVIAAYNGGAARVQSAIKKAGSRNFWDLQYYLPAESRTHVKKFIATHYIMEGQGGVTTTGAGDVKRLGMLPVPKEVLDNTLLQTVSGKYLSKVIASKIDMDPVLFAQLNPGFDGKVSTDGYGMRLPKDKMDLFNEKKMEILDASVNLLLSGASSTATSYPKEIRLPAKKTK
jgi:membrane-bound lytic murein transglycosylase D